jgi:NADPH-dependent curcumin reductase CurA
LQLQAWPFVEQLTQATPSNINVYFDNVDDAMLAALRVWVHSIACGSISGYNDLQPQPGQVNLFNMMGKRLIMKSIIVGNWFNRRGNFEQEVGSYFDAGKLKSQETAVVGIE